MTTLSKQRQPELREFSPSDKQAMVQSLWNAVNNGGHALVEIPQIVRAILETQAWQDREVDGKPYHNDTFVEFITDKPLKGCGWPLEKVEALIKDDPVVLPMWREATTGKKHIHRSDADNISITPEHGTAKSYTLDRLKRNHFQLYEQVVAGKLSANAAAIEAGFRKKLSPLDQILKLIPKLTVKQRQMLIRRLKTK